MIQVTIGQSSGGFLSPPIIAAMISGLIALITAGVVAFIAWRQWRTAKDKLAIDLFDRRHVVWQRGSAAYTQALRELFLEREDGQGSLLPSPGLAEFGRAKEQAYFLFGVEVVKHWTAVEMALFHLGRGIGRKREMFEADDAFEARAPENDRYSQQAQVGWDELKRAIEPYMMMGHIAVNRPARRMRTSAARSKDAHHDRATTHQRPFDL